MSHFWRYQDLLGDEWWWSLIRGGIALLFACFAFGMPVATTGTLALLFAGYLQADSIVVFFWARAASPCPASTPLCLEAGTNLALGWVLAFLILGLLHALAPHLDPNGDVSAFVLLVLPSLYVAISAFFVLICPLLTEAGALWHLGTASSAMFPDGPFEFVYGIPALDDVRGLVTPIVTLRWGNIGDRRLVVAPRLFAALGGRQTSDCADRNRTRIVARRLGRLGIAGLGNIPEAVRRTRSLRADGVVWRVFGALRRDNARLCSAGADKRRQQA
jgi:uncharacterized membrane protein HdeD (DUF308 family)